MGKQGADNDGTGKHVVVGKGTKGRDSVGLSEARERGLNIAALEADVSTLRVMGGKGGAALGSEEERASETGLEDDMDVANNVEPTVAREGDEIDD
jgi:hypothetical protein